MAAPWQPTPETTYEEYMERGDLQGGVRVWKKCTLQGKSEIRRIEWKNAEGKLHRDGDLPAEVCNNIECCKVRSWWKNGEQHRDGDLPAVVLADGGNEWYKHGGLHRDGDMPAAVYPSGSMWFQNGKHHRDGNLPSSVWNSGNLVWYVHGTQTGNRDNPPPGAIFPGQLTKPCRTLR